MVGRAATENDDEFNILIDDLPANWEGQNTPGVRRVIRTTNESSLSIELEIEFDDIEAYQHWRGIFVEHYRSRPVFLMLDQMGLYPTIGLYAYNPT